MQAAELTPSPRYQALYKATVLDAANSGGPMMGRLVVAARHALQARATASRDMRTRDALNEASNLLLIHEADLCKRYPEALLAAFENPESTKKALVTPIATVHFDELELMDEAQVQVSVTMAKAQQGALLAAEASLAELNTLVCAVLGLSTVKPERNPLRPETYVDVLKDVLEHTPASPTQRSEWFAAITVTLGKELATLYATLCAQLRVEEVAPAGYAVLQTPGGEAGRGGDRDRDHDEEGDVNAADGDVSSSARSSGAGAGAGVTVPVQAAGPGQGRVGAQSVQNPARSRAGNAALLTLDKLRRLLSGELDQQTTGKEDKRVADFARQFAQQFDADAAYTDAPPTDFDATVPAAFEALTEMKQANQVVARLEQRRQGATPVAPQDQSVAGLREFLRRSATGVAQALSLEVVTLMVENIARDPQLLEPIRAVVRDLESPLLLLSLVDPRFFTDKQHPARQLLHEITHRSMAFKSVQSSGFAEFLKSVQDGVLPLQQATIDNAEPFERVLGALQVGWRSASQDRDRAREAAVKVLQHAEQRNMLAEKIACKIIAHPDADSVPRVVIEFLCGPWAQVVAQTRIVGGADASAADKYQALISAMLWSAHPELTRKNIAKLTRLVPLLLSTVREGLEMIHYPATKTSVFLEALMGLHQLAFRASSKPADVADPQATAPTPTGSPPQMAMAQGHLHVVDDGNPWVAPEEAEASNFMEMPELALGEDGGSGNSAQTQNDRHGLVQGDDLPLGTWVELLINDQWVRTQLTWTSPHGTLFLFTSIFGTTQSMTRRSRDRLVSGGTLRVVSNQTVVEGALDAVAQMAMRNSIDITL